MTFSSMLSGRPAYTLLNRIVILRLMEAMDLRAVAEIFERAQGNS